MITDLLKRWVGASQEETAQGDGEDTAVPEAHDTSPSGWDGWSSNMPSDGIAEQENAPANSSVQHKHAPAQASSSEQKKQSIGSKFLQRFRKPRSVTPAAQRTAQGQRLQPGGSRFPLPVNRQMASGGRGQVHNLSGRRMQVPQQQWPQRSQVGNHSSGNPDPRMRSMVGMEMGPRRQFTGNMGYPLQQGYRQRPGWPGAHAPSQGQPLPARHPLPGRQSMQGMSQMHRMPHMPGRQPMPRGWPPQQEWPGMRGMGRNALQRVPRGPRSPWG